MYGDFWTDIEYRLISDPDSVKLMIKNKTMTIHDRNPAQRTVLMRASSLGCYELVQFCKCLYCLYKSKNSPQSLNFL